MKDENKKCEPVAWLYSDPDGNANPITCTERASDAERGGWLETPLYTHADPGDLLYAAQMLTISKNECDRLRAQLVEAHALLRESLDELDRGTSTFSKATLRNRIHAALFTSAEPNHDR